MTDHSALIERLEERVAYDKRHFTVDPLHAEAAAALRDQQARLKRWEPQLVCEASWSSSVRENRAVVPSDVTPKTDLSRHPKGDVVFSPGDALKVIDVTGSGGSLYKVRHADGREGMWANTCFRPLPSAPNQAKAAGE